MSDSFAEEEVFNRVLKSEEERTGALDEEVEEVSLRIAEDARPNRGPAQSRKGGEGRRNRVRDTVPINATTTPRREERRSATIPLGEDDTNREPPIPQGVGQRSDRASEQLKARIHSGMLDEGKHEVDGGRPAMDPICND